MEEEYVRLRCPSCGRESQVPAQLETFSCVYCGARLQKSELLAEGRRADPADLQYALEHLFDGIRNYPHQYKQFTKKRFETSFQSYLSENAPTYEAMDRYVCSLPSQRAELLDQFVSRFLTDWEDFHNTGRKSGGTSRRAFENKLTLAWYLAPAVRRMELSVAEDYLDLLRRRFVERYPDNVFELASYDDLAGGFRKHGFCFVTTAVCEAEGKPDDCAELTAFRGFRDGWLSKTKAGREMISEYYEVAPAIVAAMRYGDRESECCAELQRDYLSPCYDAILRQENRRCLELYRSMIHLLMDRYGLS